MRVFVVVGLFGCGQIDGSKEATFDARSQSLTESESWLEFNGSWTFCPGPCANSGATGVTADGALIQGITSPNMGDGGHSMKTWVHAEGGYGNKYFYVPRSGSTGAPSSRITAATYELYLYVPAAYTTNYQALEFELQQQLGTTVWNMAWQYQLSSNSWRIFHFPDDADHGWHASGITQSADFAANTWYHIVADYSTTATSVTHAALQVQKKNGDGTWSSVLKTTTPTQWRTNPTGHESSSATKWNNAVQLDGKPGIYYEVFWDNIRVTWTY